eukprot:scaffold2045_cov404-Prasinococcus_capsulatus_cf.AAC.57
MSWVSARRAAVDCRTRDTDTLWPRRATPVSPSSASVSRMETLAILVGCAQVTTASVYGITGLHLREDTPARPQAKLPFPVSAATQNVAARLGADVFLVVRSASSVSLVRRERPWRRAAASQVAPRCPTALRTASTRSALQDARRLRPPAAVPFVVADDGDDDDSDSPSRPVTSWSSGRRRGALAVPSTHAHHGQLLVEGRVSRRSGRTCWSRGCSRP